MPDKFRYDYAVIRVVPKVDREEFINAGVIVFCDQQDYLTARVELDEARLLALAPDAGRFGIGTFLPSAVLRRRVAGGERGAQRDALLRHQLEDL